MVSGSPDADVLIVGGGIAGLSAAWFAARAGREVTVVDDGRHRASDLPIALVNPLRGHAGRLVRDGIDGMRATFALIDALRADGHAIDHGRGLYRPLIDLDGEALAEAWWHARLDSRLAFDWHAIAPSSLGLVDDVPSLLLHEPGWVAAPQMLRSLRVASGATWIDDSVVAIAANDQGGTVTLSDGTRIVARSVLWCGGAWGAACLDRAADGDLTRDGLYKPGSLVGTRATLTSAPLAFGLYAIPLAAGATLVGPTREGSRSGFDDADTPAHVVAHLQDRITRTFGSTMTLTPIWRGVRLARLSSAARRALDGTATLTALDSRGFLMAPLLAAEWSRSL
jgi:glycine/D-amino acid oxidase-like deaminating enzyme